MAVTGWRAVLVACLIVGLAACSTPGPAAVAVPPPAAAPPTAPAVAPPTLRVLQLNLCSSGIAGCYTGRSTAQAAEAIRAARPDVVTLNEACDADVAALERVLADDAAVSAFQAARDGRTGEPYRCRNGRRYGNGIVSRLPVVPGSSPAGGIYPAQDLDDPEERSWVCLDLAADPPVAVCTTHLAYTKREVAGAQCRYLFDTVVGGLRARDGAAPVVLGGDLNLGDGASPDLRACLPAGSALVDDGGEQHVVATPEYAVAAHERIDLRGTTDHPGLLVTLAPR